MINKELTATFSFAVKEAKKRRHENVCLEHVLFAILHDGFGTEIIENCGGNINNLKNKLLIVINIPNACILLIINPVQFFC